MSCCGKGKAVLEIAKGNVGVVVEHYFKLPLFKCSDTNRRMRICRACQHGTWMTKRQYAAWLADHGVEVAKNIEDLTVLDPLPKQEYTKEQRRIFCRHCKCYLPAKARLEDQTCPLGKWDFKGGLIP